MSSGSVHLFAKLYLDEDVHKKAAIVLRMRGFDVVSVHEISRRGMTDRQQLDYAISQRRALVTFNIADYVELNNEYMASGRRHYGIILSKQLAIGEIVRSLLQLLNKFTADELESNLWWL